MKRSPSAAKRLCALILCAALAFAPLHAMGESAQVSSVQIQNLYKLCKIWGYVKYTHSAFLLGKEDWDEAFLNLCDPVMDAATGEEVNAILFDWLTSLGTVDYGRVYFDLDWANAPEDARIYLADTSWRGDSDDLGQDLSAALMGLNDIPVISRGKAPVRYPVYLQVYRNNVDYSSGGFSNEKTYEHMDYSDPRYRLLALFRLWNAMEYFYPYLDLLDDDWNDALMELIPEMLEGTDKHSYQLTLAKLSAKLHDAHVYFTDPLFLLEELGWYGAPVNLIYAENQLVVRDTYADCALKPGDVILEMNGEDIWDIVRSRRQYISVTTDEKLMNSLAVFLLRSNKRDMEFTILRGNTKQTVAVRGAMNIYDSTPTPPDESHELLEGNIGLINPSLLSPKDVPGVVDEFADTNGIIVDLRQYPGFDWKLFNELMDYFVNEDVTFALVETPSRTVPGAYIRHELMYAEGHPDRVYEKPVVLLMNENTQSAGEQYVMALRMGQSVTAIGENSVGSDGAVSIVPLPDGNMMLFSSLGILTLDGGQTQRVGVSPDIYVAPSIEGVSEGRDELMEAAVAFILDRQ